MSRQYRISSVTITKAACNGGPSGAIALTVAGGTPQYNFGWTGPNGYTASTQNISNLKAGDYRLTLLDANTCRIDSLITVTEPITLNVTASTTDAANTPNGTITLSVAGGTPQYSYAWTGNGVNPTSQNQTGLCPGTYNVTVTDANQCTSSRAVQLGGSCNNPIRIPVTPVPENAGCPLPTTV